MSNAFAGQFTQLQRNGVKIAELTKIQASGSKQDLLDVTNFDSPTRYREYLGTLVDAGDINFDGNFIAGDVTQQQLNADFDTGAINPYSIILPNDPATGNTRGHWDFDAIVMSVDFDLQHDKQATISGKLKITGDRPFTAGA